jgi:hypothetical protein
MDSLWAWALALLVYDLTSYWAHRHGHEINAMWSVHAVHHAAEDFNLAAALRQPLFSHLYTWVYRLPLALFMPTEMFVGLVIIDYLYQFILHTQYVPRLGPIGWLLNTPSHHRVHHGRDEKYMDRNYGGMLIIWDRLFGTFQPEEETPDYGITDPVGTLDPIWGNLVFWSRMIDATRRAPDMRTRIAVWLRGPGEQAALPMKRPRSATSVVSVDESVPMRTCIYILAHAMLALPALPALIYFGQLWGPVVQLGLAGFILISTSGLVALIEKRSWARGLEGFRLLALVLGLLWLVPASIQASGELWPDNSIPEDDPVAQAPG